MTNGWIVTFGPYGIPLQIKPVEGMISSKEKQIKILQFNSNTQKKPCRRLTIPEGNSILSDRTIADIFGINIWNCNQVLRIACFITSHGFGHATRSIAGTEQIGTKRKCKTFYFQHLTRLVF
jgi:hypothetical protein